MAGTVRRAGSGEGGSWAVDLAVGGSDRKPRMTAVLTSLLRSLKELAEPRIWRILAKSIAVTLVLFALVGAAGWYLIDTGLAAAGLSDERLGEAGAVRGAAAALLAALGLWLAWRILAMAVLQFFADEVVAVVEARDYPRAASCARDLSLGEQACASLRAGGRALLVNLLAAPVALALLVTGVGPAMLLFAVNAWLIGRELQDMVWLRHRRARDSAAPVSVAERFVLGGAVAGLLVIPFVSLLAPVLGAASATHLLHRKAQR